MAITMQQKELSLADVRGLVTTCHMRGKHEAGRAFDTLACNMEARGRDSILMSDINDEHMKGMLEFLISEGNRDS